MGRSFNVDNRAKDREQDELTIGDVVWKPVRRTNKVTGEVQAIATHTEELTKRAAAAEEAGEPIPKEVTAEFNTLLYEQIALLIRDGDGKPPAGPKRDEHGAVTEEGFLEQHLDIRDATPVLRFLMGNDPDQPLQGEDVDEDESGEGGAPLSTPTSSPTPTSPASAPSSESSDVSAEQMPAPDGSGEEDWPGPAEVTEATAPATRTPTG
jgi:hypothetical protein